MLSAYGGVETGNGVELRTDRPGALILKLSEVQDPVEEVAAALARFGGDRFTDHRPIRRLAPAAADFTVVLRGYDRSQVDVVISRAQGALSGDGAAAQREARAELEASRAALRVVARGYDRIQVDAFLDQLAADLAKAG
jgi:DivIVA domain-containing protein